MQINYLGVLVSTVASVVIGSIWYGPLFGKVFMETVGMNEWSPERKEAEKKKMPLAYFLQFVGSFVMFFVLDWYVITSMHEGVYGGVANALGLWLGFIVPLALGNAIWGGKMKMFWLNIGNMFFTLLVGGAILGFMR